MSFRLEIYKEVMYDLLTQQSSDIKIQENPETGIVIEGLSEVYLSSIDEFFEYVDLSQSNRKVAETKLNHNSSRSHCILILEVTQSFKKEKIILFIIVILTIALKVLIIIIILILN